MECELPAFYVHSEPVARKRHKCCECGSPIEKGEKHFVCTGKWNGEAPTTRRQHLLCMEACMFIRDEFNDGECIGFGDLYDSFGQMRRDYDPKHEKWRKLFRMMVKIRRRSKKGKE